jgi:hypothetical protein
VGIVDVEQPGPLGALKLEEIRRAAEHRLQEIEPLIAEADRLRDVLSVLDRHQTTSAATNGNGAHDPSRARKGANKRVILALVRQRPGITTAEISDVTHIKRTVVASTVSRLKRHGELQQHEDGVRLADVRERA